MENYEFQITPYDTENLLQQVSRALEKRTELVSKARYPGLWENIDKLTAMSKGRRRSRLRTKIMSVICLVLGVILFIPGLMEPQELLVPLLAGALAIGAGIGGLWRSRKRRENPFDQSAKRLLMGKDTISAEQSLVVSFSASGMEIRADDSDPQRIPYSDFESVIETNDLFLLVHDTRVTVLQKKDLTSHTTPEFCAFVSENVPSFQSIM